MRPAYEVMFALRKDSPTKFTHGDPVTRSDFADDNSSRDLHDGIRDRVYRLHIGILVPLNVQAFLYAVAISVSLWRLGSITYAAASPTFMPEMYALFKLF